MERQILESIRAAIMLCFLIRIVGSGTTIIAAERQGRTCYAMEIEPRYVDASVNRWETYTGQKAKRISDVLISRPCKQRLNRPSRKPSNGWSR